MNFHKRYSALFTVQVAPFVFALLIGSVSFNEHAYSERRPSSFESTIFESNTDQQGVLSVRDVLRSVQQHHPVLQQEILKVEESTAQQLSAAGAYDPTLKSKNYSYLDGFYTGSSSETRIELPVAPAFGSLFAGYRNGSGTLPVYEDEYQTLSGGEYGLGGSISLLRDFLIDKRKLGVALADYDRQTAELGVTKSKVILQQAALQSYWSWVVQSQILNIYKRLLEVGEKRQQQLDARVSAGDLAAFEALDNRRSVLQRQARVLYQNGIVQEFANNLSLFIRNPESLPRVPNQKEVPTKLPKCTSLSVPQDLLIDEAFRTRPDLQQLSVQIERLDKELEYQKTRLLPSVELSSSVTRDYGSGSISRDGTEVKGFLSIEVPLRQRTARGKVTKTELEMRRKRLAIRFLQEQVKANVPTYLIQIQQSYKRFGVSQQELDATRKLQKGETTRFQDGDSNLLFLAMRELAAAEAEVHVLQALGENLIYHSKLDAELGRVESLG